QSVSKSGALQKELRTALSELEKKAPGEVYFIPVLIEATELPDLTMGTIHLRDYQAVKVYEEKGVQKLIDQLQSQNGVVKPVVKKDVLKQMLHNHIAEDRITAALELLRNATGASHPERRNDVILLSARHITLERHYNRGIIRREEHLLEKNKIMYALLELAEQLDGDL
ncbi:MAG: hypothetical protein KDD04_02960, partial [Sinomicrobium sp.]|nr:hypothetical protein [Sinomicrobium sp.]